MHKIISTLFFAIFAFAAIGQYKMRPVTDLISTDNQAWQAIKEMIDSATNKVEILARDTAVIKDALYKTQISTRSALGSIVYNTGGLLVDDGWIRIPGSGNKKLSRTVPGWNLGKTIVHFGDRPAYLLVADDAIGGLFAMNIGGLGSDTGNIYYMTPDALDWQPLAMDYVDFLQFCFTGDLGKFYEGLRWTNWRAEVAKLDTGKAYYFVPPLYSKEGKDINKDMRSAIPVDELYKYNMKMRITLGIDK